MQSISQTRHAVLTDNCLMWIEGQGFHKETASCRLLGELAEGAYPHFISHVWIYPGREINITHFPNWNFSPYENRKKQIIGINVRKAGHQRKDLEVIFPQHTSWWGSDNAPGWMQGASPHDLLITIHYLERALGVPVSSSPGRTGWNYLKTIRPEWIEEIPVDLAACHFTRAAAMDIIWDRALLPGERLKAYLHKFDKGAAYPYAGSQTDIGVGIPVHVPHGEDARHEKSHPQAVGVWRCTIAYRPGSYDPLLPPIWKEDRGSYAATEGWLVGPIIRLLRSQGHEVTVHEGYVFPERHDLLVKWADSLWNIRQGFDTPGRWVNEKCAKLARQATKQMVNSMIGMTAFRGFEDDDEMKRPDIRLQVIGRHRELTWHNINKIKQLYGVTPVIVYMDAIYLISDEQDGRKAFPELVKREGKLGGWRYEGGISMDEAAPILTAKLSEGAKLEALNAIGWVK